MKFRTYRRTAFVTISFLAFTGAAAADKAVEDVAAKCAEVKSKLGSSLAPAVVLDNWSVTVVSGEKTPPGFSDRRPEKTELMVWPRVLVDFVETDDVEGVVLWGQVGDSYWAAWADDSKSTCRLMEGTAELVRSSDGLASLRMDGAEKRILELDDGSGAKTTIVFQLDMPEGSEAPGDWTKGHACETSSQCRNSCKGTKPNRFCT